MTFRQSVPPRAWIVTFAGTAINLCLGILYAWSIWNAELIGATEPLEAKRSRNNLGAIE